MEINTLCARHLPREQAAGGPSSSGFQRVPPPHTPPRGVLIARANHGRVKFITKRDTLFFSAGVCVWGRGVHLQGGIQMCGEAPAMRKLLTRLQGGARIDRRP